MMAFHGHTDGKVTEMGNLQLKALTKATTDLNLCAIYTSPLQRAMETAKAINENYHLPIQTDDNLMEIYCGEWEGKDWEYIYAHYPDSYIAWETSPEQFQSPDGESMQDAYNRITACIHDHVKDHIGETIAIVGHSAVFRCYLAHVLYGELKNLTEIGWGDNTYICKIIFDDNLKPTLCYKYDASHLTEDISTTALRKRLGLKRPRALKE